MKGVRGGSTACRLQEPTQTKTATLADTTTWADVTTFYGSLQPVTATESLIYEREGVVATHKVYVGKIGDQYITDLKAKNRIVVDNLWNPLGSLTYDITGVEPWRTRTGKQLHHFKLALKVIE